MTRPAPWRGHLFAMEMEQGRWLTAVAVAVVFAAPALTAIETHHSKVDYNLFEGTEVLGALATLLIA